MNQDNESSGALPQADRATHEPNPVPGFGHSVGVPSAEGIPAGPYCYRSLAPMDDRGMMKINGLCPFWERRPDGVICAYLNERDDLGLVEDQVKICGVNDEREEEA